MLVYVRSRVSVCVCVCGLTLCGGGAEHGAALAVHGVDAGAPEEQQAHGARVPRGGGRPQRGAPGRVTGFDVRLSLQQQLAYLPTNPIHTHTT